MQCFVVQPFSEPYNARYRDTFAAAIEAAGFKPYRVDEDPAASIPIDKIESEIRSSICCFVDISEDNPNVWFELGYAIAAKKPLCIVCSEERGAKFPFDIQHRAIIKYSTNSRSDFDRLSTAITERLSAIMRQYETEGALSGVVSPVAQVGDELDHYEFSCLALLAGETLSTESNVTLPTLNDAMERAGFTPQATALAVHALRRRKLIEPVQVSDYNGEAYIAWHMTDLGFDTLRGLRSKLSLTYTATANLPQEKFSADFDDEIPF